MTTRDCRNQHLEPFRTLYQLDSICSCGCEEELVRLGQCLLSSNFHLQARFSPFGITSAFRTKRRHSSLYKVLFTGTSWRSRVTKWIASENAPIGWAAKWPGQPISKVSSDSRQSIRPTVQVAWGPLVQISGFVLIGHQSALSAINYLPVPRFPLALLFFAINRHG